MTPDGRSKGTGIVAFDNPDDARNAIQQFNGYEWQGRNLEVREDRFAGASPGFGRGGFGGGYGARGAFRGGYGGGRGGYGGGMGRGGYYGGGGGGGGAGAGAGGPGFQAGAASNPPNPFTDGAGPRGEPSDAIFVDNVSLITNRRSGTDSSANRFPTASLVHKQRRSG
jgi:RNA recognition motif-containing protein